MSVKRYLRILLVYSLFGLILIPVCSAKPYKTLNYHSVDPVSAGKWITRETIISWETDDPGVYRVSGSFTMVWVGEEDTWVRVIHYSGTSESWSSLAQNYLLTGKMEYTLQYSVYGDPSADDGYDGEYRIWYENGNIVRQEGKGYLWLN